MIDISRRGRNLVAPLVILTGLAGCDSNDNDTIENTGSTSTASTVSITGIVAKGVVNGVTVTAYQLNTDGTKGDQVGSGLTNADGSYSIAFAGTYDGGPVKLEVTHVEGASMKCDMPEGCGDGVPFGGTYTLASDFTLSTLTSGVKETDSINVTALTTMAAKVTETQLASGASADADALADQIAEVNSEIADLFGISTTDGGDLTKVPVIDLTDPVVIASASADELRYAALGPAIVAAVQSEEGSTASIEDALASFIDANSDGSVRGDTEESGVTDLQEIIEASITVIEAADEAAPDTDIGALNEVTTVLENDALSLEGLDVDLNGTADETIEEDLSDDIAKAKAAVAQVREMSRTTFMDALDAENNNAGAATAFQSQLSAADDAVEADYVFEATGLAIEAIARLAEGESTDPLILDDKGATVTATLEGTIYTVNQIINISDEDETGQLIEKEVTVNITANYNNQIDETETVSVDGLDDQGTAKGSVALSISGTATSVDPSTGADTTLTINSGSSVQGTIDLAYQGEGIDDHTFYSGQDVITETGTDTSDITLTSLAINLDSTLSYADSAGTTSFQGKIQFGIDSLVFNSDETETLERAQDLSVTETDTEALSVRLGNLALQIHGTFKYTAEGSAIDDEFKASLGVLIDGGNRELTSNCEDTYSNFQHTSNCADNLADTVIDVQFALIFDAKLNGVEEIAKVELTGVRDTTDGALGDVDIDLNIAYPGVELDLDLDTTGLDGDFQEAVLTVSNMSGVRFAIRAELDETIERGDQHTIHEGSIAVVEGASLKIVGKISYNPDTDIVTFFYDDGTFETLQ